MFSLNVSIRFLSPKISYRGDKPTWNLPEFKAQFFPYNPKKVTFTVPGKHVLEIDGKGSFALDEFLQPEGAKTKGIAVLVERFLKKGIINVKPALKKFTSAIFLCLHLNP